MVRTHRIRWFAATLAAAGLLGAGPATSQTLIVRTGRIPGEVEADVTSERSGTPSGLHIDRARTINLDHQMNDGAGYRWDIQSYGTVGSGTNNAYSGGMYLQITNDNLRLQGQAWGNAEGDEIEIGPYLPRRGQPLQAYRRVKVYRDQGLARWVDILQNTSGQPLSLDVRMYTCFNWTVPQVISNSGAASPGEKDWAFVTVTGAGMGNNIPSVLHVYGDKRSKVRPRLQLQGNQVYLIYSLTIPARGTAILCHFQAQNQSIDALKEQMQGLKASKLLKDLPSQVRKLIVNFTGGSGPGGVDLERSESADTVILSEDDPIYGSIQNSAYAVQTLLGKLDLPARDVVGMVASPAEEESFRFLLADGQVVSGRSPDTKLTLKLPSGGQLEIPLTKTRSWSYRLSSQRPDDPAAKGPVVLLRTLDQLAFDPQKTRFVFRTRHGIIELKPEDLLEVVLDNPENGVHRAVFLNGARLAGLLEGETLTLTLRLGRSLEVPRNLITRIRFAPEEGDAEGPCRALLSNEDELVGNLVDEKITLSTQFGTVQMSPGTVKTFQFSPSHPGQLAVELWDGSVLRGQLEQKELSFQITPGPVLKVDIAQIVAIARSSTMLPEEVRTRVEELVGRLGAESFKDRQQASEELLRIGADLSKRGTSLIPLLQKHLSDGDPEVRQRIQGILEQLGVGSSPSSAAPRPVPDGWLGVKVR